MPEFIDVTDIARGSPGMYISRIAAAKNPVLVFMPNLDYTGMYEAEALASEFNIGFLNIPITLPVMDIVKQMEFAGVEVSDDLSLCIQDEVRSALIKILNHHT